MILKHVDAGRLAVVVLAGCAASIFSTTAAVQAAAAQELASGVSAPGPPPVGSDGRLFDRVGISPKLGERLPGDLQFINSSGKKVRLGDCFGEYPVILHLVYYECPMLCKLSADGLFETLSGLSLKPGEDFSIVTLSFDPEEGPELSARARDVAVKRCGRAAVEHGWQFLTGSQSEISAVTRAVGFRYAYDATTRQFAHASGIFVLTPDGTISRYLSGINYSPRDLRFAIVEASGGKVGTVRDQVLLMCYMYDPAVGKYGFAIISALRAAGLMTVGGLAAAIAVMIRRERRRNAVDRSFQRDDEHLTGRTV